MAKQTDIQLQRRDVVDTVRTVVALESRIAKRRRLNDLEPAILEEFDRRVAAQESFELDPASLFELEQ